MDLFMGMLAFFLLEMGLLASSKLKAAKKVYSDYVWYTVSYNCWALFGAYLGRLFGLSEGGTMLLAVLYASCSYIAAPPQPSCSCGCSFNRCFTGRNFPFNIFLGVPIYWEMSHWFHTIPV